MQIGLKLIVEVFEQSVLKRKKALKKENEKALDLYLKLDVALILFVEMQPFPRERKK